MHIFGENLEKIQNEDVCIYGYGFNDFHIKNNKLYQIEQVDESKINILLTHGELDSNSTQSEGYNPISTKELNALNMDYIALGHIHKRSVEQNYIVYPGSTISLGFDELGEHGIIAGEILKDKTVNLQFIKLDNREFAQKEIKVNNIYSQEELIENVNLLYLEDNKYYEIIFVGEKNFEIDIFNLYKYIKNENILKIKDNTKLKLNLEEIATENSIKGIFVKNLMKRINQEPENKEKLLKAIEIGLEIM